MKMFRKNRILVGVIMFGAGMNKHWYINDAKLHGFTVVLAPNCALIYRI